MLVIPSCHGFMSSLLGLHGWECQNLTNAVVVGQEHHHTVDAHAPATSRRQSMLESLAEGLVGHLRLIIALRLLASLLLESKSLLGSNVQLGVTVSAVSSAFLSGLS